MTNERGKKGIKQLAKVKFIEENVILQCGVMKC